VVTPHALGSAPTPATTSDPFDSQRVPTAVPSVAPLLSQADRSAPIEERTLESCELLAGGQEVRIRHGAELYRLRVTQNGKLILQK
jgi:hemin uptake protein HemP